MPIALAPLLLGAIGLGAVLTLGRKKGKTKASPLVFNDLVLKSMADQQYPKNFQVGDTIAVYVGNKDFPEPEYERFSLLYPPWVSQGALPSFYKIYDEIYEEGIGFEGQSAPVLVGYRTIKLGTNLPGPKKWSYLFVRTDENYYDTCSDCAPTDAAVQVYDADGNLKWTLPGAKDRLTLPTFTASYAGQVVELFDSLQQWQKERLRSAIGPNRYDPLIQAARSRDDIALFNEIDNVNQWFTGLPISTQASLTADITTTLGPQKMAQFKEILL